MLPALILLAAAVAGSTQAQHITYEAGDSCSLAGAPGTCRLLSQCAPALEDFRRRGKRPQHCSYVHNEPVVCCPALPVDARPPQGTAPLMSQEKAKPTVVPTTPQQRVGDIARRKCEEYTRYVFKTEPTFILSWLAEPENKTQCANPGDAFVTGGIEAKLREFPHMAMIGYGDEDHIEYLCGGSLISPLYVLTAAHCTTTSQPARWVMLGELDQSTDQDGAKPQRFKVSSIEVHPQYIDNIKYNDIALLRLEKEAVLDGTVRPACLQTEHKVPLLPHPIATGWGHLSFGGEPSDRLMKVQLPIQRYSLCEKSYEDDKSILPRGILDETQLCAGALVAGKDTCKGDSGGPLQRFTPEAPLYCMHHIIGITSFGRQCGLFDNTPAIYTRVSSFVPWIEKIVWPDEI